MRLFSASLLFALIVPLGATQITTFVGTGVDVTGNVDNKYTVISVPSGPNSYDSVPYSAYVTDPSKFPVGVPGGWFSNDAGSSWISAKPDGTSGGDNLDEFVYETQFDLTGFDPISVVLQFTAWADNQISSIKLNGVDVGYTLTNDINFISSGLGVTVTLDGSSYTFLSGINTLTFTVVNTSFLYPMNVSGLRVQVDKAEGISTVPEPATMGLFGAGLLVAGLLRRRKSA
jgi:hypothetical protein